MDFDDYDDGTEDGDDDNTEDGFIVDDTDALSDDMEEAEFDDLEEAVGGVLLDWSPETDVEPETEELSAPFDEWSQTMHDLAPELTDETLEALWEDPDKRDYNETELVDMALHPDFESQRSIQINPETGEALRDENGDFLDAPYGSKGSQRPDGMKVDDTGVHLREAKNYSNLNNLKQNIRHQTEDRQEAFGDDVDLTYVVAPNFTIEQAEKLQAYVEGKLGQNLEWQLK